MIRYKQGHADSTIRRELRIVLLKPVFFWNNSRPKSLVTASTQNPIKHTTNMKKLLLTSILAFTATLAYAGSGCCSAGGDKDKSKDAGKSGFSEASIVVAGSGCGGGSCGDKDKSSKSGLTEASTLWLPVQAAAVLVAIKMQRKTLASPILAKPRRPSQVTAAMVAPAATKIPSRNSAHPTRSLLVAAAVAVPAVTREKKNPALRLAQTCLPKQSNLKLRPLHFQSPAGHAAGLFRVQPD